MKQWLLVVFLVVTANYINAQHSDQTLGRKAPLVSEPTDVEVPFTGETIEDVLSIPELNGWKAVDTMQNTYGTALSSINPLAYDPGSNVVALVHRASITYGSSSGELWYNISTNRGVTWTRIPVAINNGLSKMARFPSMAISNPSNGSIANTVGLFTWSELIQGAFGGAGYGFDQPLGNGTSASNMDNTTQYSSQVPAWTSANTHWMFWASDNQIDASITLFRTHDFITIDVITPPAWSASVFQNDYNQIGGGASALDGTLYFGVVGTFPPPDPLNPILSGWFPGVSKSTDHGATWSAFEVIDFRVIPGLSSFDRLFDYRKDSDPTPVYQTDIHVDKYGLPHMLVSLTDVVGSNNSGINALVEIFKTPAGHWDGHVIYWNIPDHAYKLRGPALGQMGPSGYLAFDKTRSIMVAQWVAPVQNDSLCDILISWRNVDEPLWSPPINITNTPGMNENASHLAPYLAGDFGTGTITAFSLFTYPAGYAGHFPDAGGYENLPSVIFIKPVDIPLSLIPYAPSHLIVTPSGTGKINLAWADNALNETGYVVERKNGDSTSWGQYSILANLGPDVTTCTDTLVADSTYYTYRVKAVYGGNSSGYSNQAQVLTPVSVESEDIVKMPLVHDLGQNYPNPFNPETSIRFELLVKSEITISVFNALGETIQTLAQGTYDAGRHDVRFYAKDLPSGVYFYRLQAGAYIKTQKMVLMR